MQKLLILGNGFDRTHNLPTRYKDLLNFVFDESASYFKKLCQYIPEDALWSDFEMALSYLDYEQLQDDNLCYLQNYEDDDWRDSAHHDFQYMIEEHLSFADYIPRYFLNWIKCIDTKSKPILGTNLINKDYLYLNFNYTDTLEKTYGIPSDHILYIHGKAANNKPLVVGHHEKSLWQENTPHFDSEEEQQEYYDNFSEDVRITESKEIIRHYFNQTYKDTEAIIKYNKPFFDSLKDINEIVIFGHSLSEIDMEYFLKIKSIVMLSSKWQISYHTPKDKTNAQNLVKKLSLPSQSYELFPV